MQWVGRFYATLLVSPSALNHLDRLSNVPWGYQMFHGAIKCSIVAIHLTISVPRDPKQARKYFEPLQRTCPCMEQGMIVRFAVQNMDLLMADCMMRRSVEFGQIALEKSDFHTQTGLFPSFGRSLSIQMSAYPPNEKVIAKSHCKSLEERFAAWVQCYVLEGQGIEVECAAMHYGPKHGFLAFKSMCVW